MLVTIENQLSTPINYLETITGGVGTAALNAVGGNRVQPLPYPFAHVGTLAANGGADSVQLAMHPADWRYKAVPWLPQEPATEWNVLVQAGVVTIAIAAETNKTDSEELFLAAL